MRSRNPWTAPIVRPGADCSRLSENNAASHPSLRRSPPAFFGLAIQLAPQAARKHESLPSVQGIGAISLTADFCHCIPSQVPNADGDDAGRGSSVGDRSDIAGYAVVARYYL